MRLIETDGSLLLQVEDILGRSERKTARVRGGEHKPGQIDYKIFLGKQVRAQQLYNVKHNRSDTNDWEGQEISVICYSDRYLCVKI